MIKCTPSPASRLKFLDRQITTRQLIFLVLLFLCLTPWISPPLSLCLGLVVAQFVGHPFLYLNQKATSLLLQVSVVALGFGMNAVTALTAGREGILFTMASIVGTLVLGIVLTHVFGADRKSAHLVSCGTAICGGSAIAAISPIIGAEEKQISVALATVFILNSIALLLFPLIGHALHLSQTQFGLWCAIAIHDTSSVVGAATKYGTRALEVATTVKLARALWIIPVALVTSVFFNNKNRKIKVPYFIGLFIIAMLLNTYVPAVSTVAPFFVTFGKTGLTLTLFLIGAGLSRKVLSSVGIKPLLHGVLLWIIISVATLYSILSFA